MCCRFSGVVYQLVGLVPGLTRTEPAAALGKLWNQPCPAPIRKNNSWISPSVPTYARCWTFSGVVYQLVGLVSGLTVTALFAAPGKLCSQPWPAPIRKKSSCTSPSVPTYPICCRFSGVVYQLVGLVPGLTGTLPAAALG